MQSTLDLLKQAFELKENNCYKQAIEMLYKALELESDNIEILAQLGELYFLLGNHDRAQQYIKQVLDKNSNHVESLVILRDIYNARKEYDQALIFAVSSYEQNNSVANLTSLIQILSKLDRMDEVKSLAQKRREEASFAYAQALYERKQFAQARKILSEAPQNQDVLFLLGKIYFDEGDVENARKVFEQVSENSPDQERNAQIFNYKGLFALEDMKFIEAITLFSKATNADYTLSVYFYNLGNAYFYNGWLEESAKAYLKAVCMSPENLEYRYSLAYLYYENSQFERAQGEVEYILSINPKHPGAIVLGALLKLHNKDFLGAKMDLESLISCGNEDDFTLLSLVKVYNELGTFEKSEKLMKKVIKNNRDNLNYKCDLSQIYVKEKNYKKALKIADEIIKDNENFIAAYIVGADAALQLDQHEDAKNYAQNAIALDMNYAPGYYYLALVRRCEKDYDEALECMQRAITSDPTNAKYYAKMAELFAEAGDPKAAMEYASEAVNIDENCAEYKTLYSELAVINRKS